MIFIGFGPPDFFSLPCKEFGSLTAIGSLWQPAQLWLLSSLIQPTNIYLEPRHRGSPGDAATAESGLVPTVRKLLGDREVSQRSHKGPCSSMPTLGLQRKGIQRTRWDLTRRGAQQRHVQRPWGERAYWKLKGPRENQCVLRKSGKEEG